MIELIEDRASRQGVTSDRNIVVFVQADNLRKRVYRVLRCREIFEERVVFACAATRNRE
jgi:hypothetical protein